MKCEEELRKKKEVIEMILHEDMEEHLFNNAKRTRLKWKLWALNWVLEEENKDE